MRRIYAIYDLKAHDIVADVLTLHRHDGTAVRMFTDALGGKGDLANHPADYKLVRLGDYEEFTYDEPKLVDTGFTDIYTGREWLEAIKAQDKASLAFPLPSSDR